MKRKSESKLDLSEKRQYYIFKGAYKIFFDDKKSVNPEYIEDLYLILILEPAYFV